MKLSNSIFSTRGRANRGVQGHSQTATSSNHALPIYTELILSMRQKIACVLISGVLFWSMGYLFFWNAWLAALLIACTYWMPRMWSRFLLKRRRDTLSLHFKQMLYSLSTSLAAGRSVENAFKEAVNDLSFLYPDGSTDMIRELNIICARLEYGQPIEEALQDLSQRAALEDITNFADVFSSCKRTGGDLVEVIRRTSSMIGEKMEVSMEIGVLLAQKRLESKLLLAAPIFLVGFMDVSSPDYMDPLHSGVGLIITFVALLLFGCAFWLINKIMSIKV